MLLLSIAVVLEIGDAEYNECLWNNKCIQDKRNPEENFVFSREEEAEKGN